MGALPCTNTPTLFAPASAASRISARTVSAGGSSLISVSGKRARPVLRGPRRGNAPGLPDEIFFGIITRQAIRRGAFRNVKDLTNAIGRFIDAYNPRCQPFMWTKDADELIAKIRPSKN